MLARPQIHEHHSYDFRSSAVRIGMVVGVGLSLALTGWVYVVNSISIFDRGSFERNLVAAVLIGTMALFPVLRFIREPGDLLVSSLVAWGILTLTYSTLSLFSWAIRDWFTTFQFFLLGALLYLIAATLSWIGTCIWKARAAHLAPPRHRAS
jgi:hypothetical protein